MALSSLTSYGTTKPTGYSAYSPAPTGSLRSGNLEGQVSFGVLGYLTNDRNTLVFQVDTVANVSAALAFNSNKTSVDVTDSAVSQSPATTNYYSVNMGLNTVSGGDWTLTLGVTLMDGTTASYIFVKGKPPEQPKRPQ